MFSELEGKDINEVISEGMGKLASMPSGNIYICACLASHVSCLAPLSVSLAGGAVTAASSGGGGGGGDAAAEQKEEAKEEKKEEEEEESDDDMGFGLFD